MTYKESLTAAMTTLAQDPRRVFIGYGLLAGRAMQTLEGVPERQIIETPVAEGLMTSMAIGQSIAGNLPVVYFERSDFLLNAMDAIVNHLNAIARLSRGEFKPAVILRITVGNKTKPLFTGPVHTQDFSHALACMANNMWVGKLTNTEPGSVERYYSGAAEAQLKGESTALFEYKDLM